MNDTLDLPPDGPIGQVLGGTVPRNTARMEIGFGDGTTFQADVGNDPFAVVFPLRGPGTDPSAPNRSVDESKVRVQLFGANGQVTFDGPLKFWHADH
jgi:hypothetical protein